MQFYGLLAASMFLALVILPLVKKRVYEVFIITHIGCAITIIYGVWQHTRSADGSFWVFPLVFTCTLITTGLLQLIRIIYRNVVVRAGQRINLGVPSVGIFYIFQSHPFAISWWESDVNGRAVSISILLRPRSGFTKRLFDRIKPNRDYGAWIDGPFGPSSVSWRLSCNVGDYGHTFMIATGIGIAAQLPYIKELLDGHEKAQVRTQRISLVWQLDRIGDYESARDLLQVLVRQDNGYVSTQFVFLMPSTYTQQMLHVSIYDPLRAHSEDQIQHIGENGLIDVHSGHANWEKHLGIEIESQMGKMIVLGKRCYSLSL
ncbi:unnamed protein product [Penicillium nalgiovense]|nr:unnamed protein product [Penicillium nalgiovense]